MHGRLLEGRVAGVVRIARLAAEVAEGRAAVGPLTVEGRRADEAAGGASEDDVRPPHELPARIAGETLENVVRPVLAAHPDPLLSPQVDDVGRGAEVEVADVPLARAIRPPGPSVPGSKREDRLVVGRRRVRATVRRPEEDETLLLVDRTRAPHVAAAPVLTDHLAVDTHGLAIRVEHGVDLEAPPLLARAGVERHDPAPVTRRATVGRGADEDPVLEDRR